MQIEFDFLNRRLQPLKYFEKNKRKKRLKEMHLRSKFSQNMKKLQNIRLSLLSKRAQYETRSRRQSGPTRQSSGHMIEPLRNSIKHVRKSSRRRQLEFKKRSSTLKQSKQTMVKNLISSRNLLFLREIDSGLT